MEETTLDNLFFLKEFNKIEEEFRMATFEALDEFEKVIKENEEKIDLSEFNQLLNKEIQIFTDLEEEKNKPENEKNKFKNESFAIKTNKNLQLLKYTQHLCNNGFIQRLLLQGYRNAGKQPLHEKSIADVRNGGSDDGTSYKSIIVITFSLLYISSKASKVHNLLELSANNEILRKILNPDTTPLLQIFNVKNEDLLKMIKESIFFSESGLISGFSGYAFGGSREEPIKKSRFSYQDCSSICAKIFQVDEECSTVDFVNAFKEQSKEEKIITENKEETINKRYAKIRDKLFPIEEKEVQIGDVIVISHYKNEKRTGGHIGIVSEINTKNGIISFVSLEREVPFIEGYSINNTAPLLDGIKSNNERLTFLRDKRMLNIYRANKTGIISTYPKINNFPRPRL